jgi:hypothetical protein
MTSSFSDPPTDPILPAEELDTLTTALRRKEGNWVQWGQWCQLLQKAGRSPQEIFEATGFEPAQQNQIIVASQVYSSMMEVGVPPEVQAYFEQRGSDSLYEFRILSQEERAAAATLVLQRGIDSEGSREVAKAMKDYSRFSVLPKGFSESAGDAVAYSYYKLARQQTELPERSRLIGQALRFADTEDARQQIQALLMEGVPQRSRPAPLMSVYRLEEDDQLPRILPVAGRMPLTLEDWKAVPIVEADGAFQVVPFSGSGAWVAVPGWSVILQADDPVGILATGSHLPPPLNEKPEEVLILVDRSQRDWQDDSYFLVQDGETNGALTLRWFERSPDLTILGKVLLVVRPKKILDEDYGTDPWQIDE